MQKRLDEQSNDLERLERLYEEEEKFVSVMEKMVESQLEDHTTLEKYSHQDNMTIKVNLTDSEMVLLTQFLKNAIGL